MASDSFTREVGPGVAGSESFPSEVKETRRDGEKCFFIFFLSKNFIVICDDEAKKKKKKILQQVSCFREAASASTAAASHKVVLPAAGCSCSVSMANCLLVSVINLLSD